MLITATAASTCVMVLVLARSRANIIPNRRGNEP